MYWFRVCTTAASYFPHSICSSTLFDVYMRMLLHLQWRLWKNEKKKNNDIDNQGKGMFLWPNEFELSAPMYILENTTIETPVKSHTESTFNESTNCIQVTVVMWWFLSPKTQTHAQCTQKKRNIFYDYVCHIVKIRWQTKNATICIMCLRCIYRNTWNSKCNIK